MTFASDRITAAHRPCGRGVARAMAVAAALGAAFAGATAASAAEKPDYRSAAGSVHLRYLNAGEGDIRAVPRIGLSFGERVMRAELDSGSTGVVVAAALIPGFDQLPVISDGRLTYTSSGRVMIGSWVTTPLSLVGEDGASVTTEPMPILAVTRVECLEQSRNCTPNDDPRDIAMVGIGFAREGDRQAESTPEKNPLLRVSAGTARKGYVLRAEGIDVGIDEKVARGDFRFVKLERQEDLPDWKAVPACISVAGASPAACGTMLVDTGVGDMFLTVPPSEAQPGPLDDGTEIAVLLGDDSASEPLYSFTTGDGSQPMAPARVHLDVSDRKKPFVNTSFHFLNGFDVLFDAEGGWVGFKRR